MPKGGLSYKSLSECLKGARAKGLPESACNVLKKPGNGGGTMPPPDDSGTRQQPNEINGLKLNFKKSIANDSNYSELALAA